MEKSRKLNSSATIKVNDEIWIEFKKNARELLGTSASSALLYLMQMFNLRGKTEGMTEIVMDAVTPAILKGIASKEKEINAIIPGIEQNVKKHVDLEIKKLKGKKK